ncbi:MAG TPA: Stk1 family PASTA domain-containing Ser/Thr kinase [Micromonosporaceae bacterium]|nr:Stk1 family PASTA domain-containing Ser/Thr kinase [Micromonosporaceae bacterium]
MTAQARLLGGRYQVGELLGYGGMAEVHRGRDLRLGRDVAIKMLRTDLARDATFQMRFRREAQNAASLNHPAIVAVYDTGEETAATGETLPFIVMEFVNGRTLKEVLAAEGRLMPRRALEICADVCAALEFSHRHGIIHRDIKPGNVMLTVTGQVKVMDFGIARALASGATTMTQTSAVIGTAQYLSPEQARGEAVDARSDVYAAGCVLFELLCGHPPFVGDSPVSVAYQHVREDPPTPSDLNPDVTPPLDAIVLKALAKNPLNRYQSAGEMRADLLRAAAGRPVMATPVLREHETMPMVAAGAVRPSGPPTRPVPAAVGNRRQRRASAWVLAVLSTIGVLAVIALVVGLYLAQKPDSPKQVAVPNVIGKQVAAAQQELRSQGLLWTQNSQKGDCTPNEVIGQNPQQGAEVNPGGTIALTVCAGAQTVQVPNLVGSTKGAAERQLKNLKLQPEFEQVDSAAPKDQVVKVPDANKEVPINTKVVVQISRDNLVNVPDVVGRTQGSARDRLKDAGFQVNVQEGRESDDPGKVVEQSPRGGGTAKKGDTVTITVTVPRPEPTAPSPTSSPEPSVSTTPPGGGGGAGSPSPASPPPLPGP